MKKFLGTIFCYLVLVLGITLIVNGAYVSISGGNDPVPEWADFQAVPDQIQICNFGSSHGEEGFHYGNISDYKCFNFALRGQSLDYDYRIMQQYQDSIGDGGVVFITISHFSLYGYPERVDENFNSKNVRYYEFLKPEYIKGYSVSNHVKSLITSRFPSVANNDPMLLIKTFLGALLNKDANDVTIFNKDRLGNTAQVAVEHHLFQGKMDGNGNRVLNQEAMDALQGMIELCREHNWRPVLVTTPYTAEYLEEVRRRAPEFLGEFESLMEDVSEQLQVEYYNYAEDPRFVQNHELFGDADHASEAGGKLFVDILLNEVVSVSK